MNNIFSLQQLINGIQLGSIYALIALGYTMVYGIVRLINFAHGDFYMVGAYAAFYAVNFYIGQQANAPMMVVLLASMAAGGLVAVIANQVAYKPLRYKPRLSSLITAIPKHLYAIGPATVSNYVAFDIAVAAMLMVFLTFLVRFTPIGMAMRAVSQDKEAAKLMGIDVEKIITITFLVGGSFAGAAGLLTGITYPRIFPYMGILPGLKAFIAAVLGGIGNIPGAMLGSYIMGIAETYASAYNSLLGEGIAFAILIVVLLFRPQGILGEKTADKI